MSASANILPITGTALPEIDIDAPFLAAKRGSFEYIELEYDQAARAAKSEPEQKLFSSLGVLCGFATNFDSISGPYQPRLRAGDRRSAVPDDLSAADLETVRLLLAKSQVPLLRARLGDLLWVRQRDHAAAKAAAADYVSAAQTFLRPDDWIFSTKWFQRGLQLGHRLGRKNAAWQTAESAIVTAMDSPLKDTEPFFLSHLLSVMEQMGAGMPAEVAERAHAQAEQARKENDGRRMRMYYEHEVKFRQAAKDPAGAKAAQLSAAASYEVEAHAALARAQPSHLAAADFLAHGVEALRRAQAAASEIARVKALLLQSQRESVKEFKSHPHTFDLSESAEKAAQMVTHHDLAEALRLLVLARPFTQPAKVRAHVLKLAQDFPISHMFGASVVDAAGRVTAHLEGMTSDNEDKAIEARMFKHVAQFEWNLRARAFIEPARQQIWTQHFPQQKALDFLVLNNPFVPPGHEGIFLRGLYYGLCGDMLLAAHLLAPQVEHSLRYVLEGHGVDIANLESDLTQPVKTLGPLLSLSETKAIFGEDCVFELRGLLIEKLGYSVRHRVAHGFVTEAECYGAATSNLWWMVLKLCYVGVLLGEQTAPEE